MSKKPVERMDKIHDLFAEGALGKDNGWTHPIPENKNTYVAKPNPDGSPPISSPTNGDTWYNPADGTMNIYYTGSSSSINGWIPYSGSAK